MDSSPTHGPTQPTQNPGATLHPPHPGKLTTTTDKTGAACLINKMLLMCPGTFGTLEVAGTPLGTRM